MASLQASSCPVNIIVVDNNSSDDTVAIVRKHSYTEIIISDDNLGFGRANNIGIKKSLELGADYLFLLNQDTWIFENTIAHLVAKMEKFPQLGIVSPVHLSPDGITPDQSFATYLSRKGKQLDNKVATVPFVNAAAWMLSRGCVAKTGIFEPAFSHYGEDRNYCDRVLYHGLEIAVSTDSQIVHDRTITRNFKKDSIQSQYKVLATLLNINYSLTTAYGKALREVFGLPKYFAKHYGLKAISLFLNLAGYYIKMLFSARKIKAIRNNHK